MKVLVVCSRRYYAPYTDYVAPFIYEQVEALRARGVECEYYLIAGGWRGYLKALCGIRKAAKTFQPDIIHAHSGLCNLVAVLSLLTHNSKRHSTFNSQRSTKIVATFHGSDVNAWSVRWLSKIAMRLADYNIFVSEQLRHIAGDVPHSAVIPCSVDTAFFHAMDKAESRQLLGWEQEKNYILFSKEFADRVKNYPLAKAAVEKLSSIEGFGSVELVELYGYNRQQMVWLYNACDCGLMTSFTEGSPQFIKEAVACGCPIVSTDVGDVREVIEGVPNARICRYDAADVAAQLQEAMAVGHLKQPALAERYTKNVITDNLLKIYNSL